MTQQSKLKQSIRARIEKTGESYTTARRHVMGQKKKARQKRSEAAAEDARQATPKGGVSDAKCTEKTGHGFDHWFAVLDRFGAPHKGHTAAARHLRDDHHVSAWYSQGITVMYERARGLRELGQSCHGDFQFSASKVLPATLAEADAALSKKAERTVWLRAVNPEVAAALHEAFRSKRMRRKDESSHIRFKTAYGTIDLGVYAHKGNRSRIAMQCAKLADEAIKSRERERWKAALGALHAHLSA